MEYLDAETNGCHTKLKTQLSSETSHQPFTPPIIILYINDLPQ